MSVSRSNQLMGLFLLVLVAIGLGVYSRQQKTVKASKSNPAVPAADSKELTVAVDESTKSIGGVQRSKSDVAFKERVDSEIVLQKVPHGFSPAVAEDDNQQVALLAVSLKDRAEPRRFSSFEQATPFSIDNFKKNPKAYLEEIEPGRVFAPAQPADGVTPIRTAGSRYHSVAQGESVRLSVAVSAGMPATFSSQGLGQFENKLTSITVMSNEKGVAEAVFTASAGTVDSVRVLAASPVHSGQSLFTVRVAIPNSNKIGDVR